MSNRPGGGSGTGIGGGDEITGKPPGFLDLRASGPSGAQAGEAGTQGAFWRQITLRGRRDLLGQAPVKLHSAQRAVFAFAGLWWMAFALKEEACWAWTSVCRAPSGAGETNRHSVIPNKINFSRLDISNPLLSKFN